MQEKKACGTAEARAEAKSKESNREGRGVARKRDAEAILPLAHDEAVKAINAELKPQDRGNYNIGEIVDRQVGPDGRADYGERVIAKLAEDPALMCSAEHLRRCWHYFRLDQEHGELRDEFPALKFGHLFQISRLLQLEGEFDASVVTDAIRFVAKQAMDRGKDGKPTPIDALARAVTTHIRSIKGRGNGGTAEPAEEPDDVGGQEDETQATRDDFVALNDGIEVVQVAAGKIAGSRRYDHPAELQVNVARIAQAYLDILGHIVRHDPQSIIIPSARRCVRDLAALVGLTVVETEASEQQEALP